MKRCFKCGVTKELSDFYKHKKMSDGHLNKCKDCAKEDVRKNREKRVEYYREYDQWRYAVLGIRKDQRAEYLKEYRAKNKDAYLAHTMVGNAVRDGKLKKPCNCSDCGNFTPSRKLHAHHNDYSVPLEVVWLCAACHAKEHPKEEYYK